MDQSYAVGTAAAQLKYALLGNPFDVLGAQIDATREDISLAFDDAVLDNRASQQELNEAKRKLLIPKARIEATLDYLPDASEGERRAAVAALGSDAALSELISIAKALPVFSRMVFLSNIAQSKPSSGLLRFFAVSHASSDDQRLTRLIASTFEQASMPAPDVGALLEARERVVTSIADRLFSGYQDIRKAASDLRKGLEEELSSATPELLAAFSVLLAAFDRKASSAVQQLRRRIEDAADRVRAEPNDARGVSALVDHLHEWDELNQPAQLLAQHKGRDDPASRDLFQYLRNLMLELANERDAATAAREINAACLEVFAELPRAVEQLATDMAALTELADQAGLKSLQSFVQDALEDLEPLVSDLKSAGFEQGVRGLGGRLYALFEEARAATSGTSAAEYAWLYVRTVALAINNDLGEGASSLKVIEGLQAHSEFRDAPPQVRASIASDIETLKSNALQARFKRAMDKGDRNAARAVLVELVGVTREPSERAQYQSAIDAVDAANNRRIIKWVIWGVIGIAAIGYASSQSRSSQSTYRASTSVTAPSQPASRTGGSTLEASLVVTEEKPPFGTNRTFNTGNIRYCLFQNERLDAMQAPLASETNSGVISSFNREVDDYNSRCASFRYYEDDLARVQREVLLKRAELTAQGHAMLRRWKGAN